MKAIAFALAIQVALFPAPAARAAQAAAADDRAVVETVRYDVRTLPADRRVVGVDTVVTVPAADADLPRPVLSIAINGIVVARRQGRPGSTVQLTGGFEDRLQSMRNTIEVAVATPGCGTPCAAMRAGTRIAAPARFRFAPVEPGATDFAQLPARMRAGVHIVAARGDATSAAAAPLAHRALAPRAPLRAEGPARIHISPFPPHGSRPAIRFDMGPVALARRDGGMVIPADALARMTVVQMLSGGPQPLVWVRPGAALPPVLDLERGDVAMFDARGRVFAYSSVTDDLVVRPVYAAGVDASGDARSVAIRRWVLLGLWVLVTLGMIVVLRRLAPPRRSEQAA